jgi:hypothetical protein
VNALRSAADAATGVAVDHLVVAATTLADGVAWCEATFGLTPPAGGQHPTMGTHNRIFSIASARYPRTYLEIIAIDPAGATPARPRWFALDEPALQRALATGPRLIHWVARCADVDATLAAFRGAGCDPGDVIAAERATPDGVLRWRISVRPDGRRLCDGALPTLIEWGDVHPSSTLPTSGCTLAALAVEGLPDSIRALLGTVDAALGNAAVMRIAGSGAGLAATSATRTRPVDGSGRFVATIETPRGAVTLESVRLAA